MCSLLLSCTSKKVETAKQKGVHYTPLSIIKTNPYATVNCPPYKIKYRRHNTPIKSNIDTRMMK
ncbi:hypothetical protein HMPREF9996_02077 [Aggregatibacter actinomycetemcomitans Y4]|nr:hypothetical protein HMPREF9996_02077 [Aggregatibacter actinomycetemcomitans Y4]